MTDHEILVELRRDVKWIKQILGNHLRHHAAATITLAAATLAALTALIVALAGR